MRSESSLAPAGSGDSLDELLPRLRRSITPPDLFADESEVLDALRSVEALRASVGELEAEVRAAAKDWIVANGPAESGGSAGVRYYVAPKKKVVCRNKEAAVEQVWTACGGDLETFAEALSKQPFRYAQARRLLGADYQNLFSEEKGEPTLQTTRPKARPGTKGTS